MFTSFDIIILAIITISSVFGGYGGMVKLIFSFLGFISSICLAYYTYPYGYEVCAQYFGDNITSVILSSISCYLVSLVICTVLTHKFLALVSIIRGGMFDRLFGFGAGVIRGLVVCLMLFWVVAVFFSGSYLQATTLDDVVKNTTVDKYPVWLQESVTMSYLEDISQYCIKILPSYQLESIKLPKITENANVTNIDELEKAYNKEKVTEKRENFSLDLKQELDEILYENHVQKK